MMITSNKAIVNNPTFAANVLNMANQYCPDPWQNNKPKPNDKKQTTTEIGKRESNRLVKGVVAELPGRWIGTCWYRVQYQAFR